MNCAIRLVASPPSGAPALGLMSLLALNLEYGEERLLGYFHRAYLFHALLPRFLLFQQFSLAAHVAAVALREHVLAQRLDGLARDDVRADRRLHGDVEHLPRDQFAHPRNEVAATVLGVLPVHHERQG